MTDFLLGISPLREVPGSFPLELQYNNLCINCGRISYKIEDLKGSFTISFGKNNNLTRIADGIFKETVINELLSSSGSFTFEA